jgi:hypothetical protein
MPGYCAACPVKRNATLESVRTRPAKISDVDLPCAKVLRNSLATALPGAGNASRCERAERPIPKGSIGRNRSRLSDIILQNAKQVALRMVRPRASTKVRSLPPDKRSVSTLLHARRERSDSEAIRPPGLGKRALFGSRSCWGVRKRHDSMEKCAICRCILAGYLPLSIFDQYSICECDYRLMRPIGYSWP